MEAMNAKSANQVSRRSFLKGGALLAGTMAATGALAGCAPQRGGDKEGLASTAAADGSWDKETDIVVVGSGTVAVAAMAASAYGAKVIVLEKTNMFGGTTIFSGQGMGIPLCHVHGEQAAADTLEDVLEYYRTASGSRADLAVGEAYAINGDKFITWLEETYGMTFGFAMGQNFYGDYYDPCKGYLGVGRNPINVTAIEGEEEGTTAWAYFNKRILSDENCELLLETPALSLVTDETGRVAGVIANDGKSDIRIKANKAVVLGTGGFEHNADMRRQYLSMPIMGLALVKVTRETARKWV